MSAIQKVVLAGASGNVGAPMLQALLNANFDVTVLTRKESKSTFPSSVKVERVDYNDPKALTEIFKGQDAFISTVSGEGFAQQTAIIDATIAAGVKRIIPSELGGDIANAQTRKLPFFSEKAKVQDYIEQKIPGTQTTWTTVRCGPFLDFCIDYGLFLDAKKKEVTLYDGGKNVFTTTPIAEVCKAYVNILRKPEQTKNRAVYIQGANVSQKQLLEMAQKCTGAGGWKVKEESTEDVEAAAWKALQEDPSNAAVWIVGFLNRNMFGAGFGSFFGEKNDNELLGVKLLNDAEVEEYVKGRVQGSSLTSSSD